MAVLERLDAGEEALFKILTDPTGVDQAEFLMVDPNKDDYCFRLYSYQKAWLADKSSQITNQGSRSVGKSLSIVLSAIAFCFNHPYQQFAIVAPTDKAVTRVTDLIEKRFIDVRLLREMLPKKSGFGIKHRPFVMHFRNNAHILGVIPQLDGSGVRGIHPLVLHTDELQDITEDAFNETVETVRKEVKGYRWICHGVPTGGRDHFYRITQEGSGWKVHRPMAIMRPDWDDEQRQQKIKDYGGSRNSPDYRRNVYGDHGQQSESLFVIRRLLKNLDMELSSEYNDAIYNHVSISAERLEDYGGSIADLIQIPGSHKKWKHFWMGADIGLVDDPTEILVFGEATPKGKEDSILTLLSRVSLSRVRPLDQADAFAHLLLQYKGSLVGMDSTGLGLGIFMDLQDKYPSLATRVRGYNFSSKRVVGFDDTVELDEKADELEERKIEKIVLEHSSDVLRELVDQYRLLLPNDGDVINSFKGERFTARKKVTDLYGRRKFSNSHKSHILDAARMMAMTWSQAKIEAFIESKKEERETVLPMWA